MLNVDLQKTTVDAVPTVPADVKVLVLDDSKFDRTRIRRMFSQTGIPHHFGEAEALGSLREALDEDVYDVILIDFNLPEGDGLEALKMIQSHPRNSQAATIMITGDDQSQVAVNALKRGCVDYIAKAQLTAQRLRSSIATAIENVEFSRFDEANRRQNIDKLTSTIVTQYSNALQPRIAKIVRDVRAIKATMDNPTSNLPGDLEAIEKRCVQLWAILTETEKLGMPRAPGQLMN